VEISGVPSPGPGIRRYQWGCQNWYDHCLGDEHRFMRTFVWPAPGCCLPVSYSTGGMPWEVMPGDGTEFRKQFNIPRPNVEGSNILLGSFHVPMAYNGLIYGVMTAFTGLGFVEGSGDLIWRVEKNRRFMKDLSFIQTSLGSFLTGVFPLTPHERIWSNDLLNLYVELAAGATGRLDPNGYVSMTLTGYFFPRPGPKQSRLQRRNVFDRSNYDMLFRDHTYEL
jgi:hypothetical protein